MFNRYWREYPWALQVMLFGLMAFTLGSFATLILTLLMPAMTGDSLRAILNLTPQNIDKQRMPFLFVQLISASFLFLLSSILFSYWSHPKVKKYLRLYTPKPLHILLAIGILLGALPLFLEMAIFFKNLAPGMGDGAEQMELILKISKPAELPMLMLVMAISPGICEELFFRGILLRFAHQRTRKLMLSAIITSILFAAVHNSIYNAPSITIAGILLCYIYYWSGSMITGMVAHTVYNAIQIYFSYLTVTNPNLKAMSASEHMPWYIVVAGTAIFILSAYSFWKTRIPLSPDWSANFTPEEMQEQNDNR